MLEPDRWAWRPQEVIRTGPRPGQSRFSNISKAVTWGPSVQVREEEEDGQRVKVLPVPSDKLDEDTAAAISAVSQSSTGALRIKMHNKLAALVALAQGK